MSFLSFHHAVFFCADAMVKTSEAARIIFDGLGAQADNNLTFMYVKPTGDDTHNGGSWTQAKSTIKSALDAIKNESAKKMYLVLIGSGEYILKEPLSMKNHVAIIGGFDASSDDAQAYKSSKKTIIRGEYNVQVFKNQDLDKPKKSTAVLANVTITEGTAEDGGGMYNLYSTSTIRHSTFFKNTANEAGGGMYNDINPSPTISSSIFWGNTKDTKDSANTPNQIEDHKDSTPVIAYSIVQGNYPKGTEIIKKNPQLKDLANNGGFVKTMAIEASISAKNKGLYGARKDKIHYYSKNNKDWFTSPILTESTKVSPLPTDATHYTTDARGYKYQDRPDIGAYEYESTTPK